MKEIMKPHLTLDTVLSEEDVMTTDLPGEHMASPNLLNVSDIVADKSMDCPNG